MDRETIYNDYLKINNYPSLAEKKIIAERYSIVSKKAKEIILEHMDVLHKCAELLLEKEKIGREEFEALFE